MTPVALLAAFCAIMATVSVGRLALDRAHDRVDIGSAVVVVGISLLALLWTALEEAWLTLAQQVSLGLVGVGVVCAGIVLIVAYWDEPPESDSSTTHE